MRVLTLAVAAAAIGLVAPVASSANAQEAKVVVRTGERDHYRDRDYRWRRERFEHRHYRDRDRVVIIKKRHYDCD